MGRTECKVDKNANALDKGFESAQFLDEIDAPCWSRLWVRS